MPTQPLTKTMLSLLLGGGIFCSLGAGLVLGYGPLTRLVEQHRVQATAETMHAEEQHASVSLSLFLASDAEELGWPLADLLRRPAAPLLFVQQDVEALTDSTGAIQGVRYDDPTGGSVPLEWVRAPNQWISPSFRLRDFAARDGAPLARISPQLVEGLERLRQRVGEVVILSGYRHPAHNLYVGGAGDSQHQAGKAADIYAPGYSPLELAILALEVMGCELGLGLGPTSLHVDVRGELATWTYVGAPVAGPAFAVLVHTQCGVPVPSYLTQRAEAIWLDDPAVEEPIVREPRAVPSVSPLARYESVLMARAAEAYPAVGPGAVILDLRSSTPGSGPRYLAAGDPLLTELGLDGLVAFCMARRAAGYFAYAVLLPDQEPLTGVMSLSASAATGHTLAPASAVDGTTVGPEIRDREADSEAGERWGIVVASAPDAASATDAVEYHQARLSARTPVRGKYEVHVVPGDGRYRVVVGDFASQREADAAMARLRSGLPADAWLLAL
jgi:hypothetical protein